MTKQLRTSLNAANKQLNQGDVSEVSKLSGISRPTCSSYLNGKGTNDDTAMKVLKAAKTVIRNRQKEIEALTQEN